MVFNSISCCLGSPYVIHILPLYAIITFACSLSIIHFRISCTRCRMSGMAALFFLYLTWFSLCALYLSQLNAMNARRKKERNKNRTKEYQNRMKRTTHTHTTDKSTLLKRHLNLRVKLHFIKILCMQHLCHMLEIYRFGRFRHLIRHSRAEPSRAAQ